ncbi:MAG: hypothetical protein HY513_01685 [Candidatus Aenigmarchaeota archaeon]|nr:hypothetical protein [Candidatus Aenigmarchaeota archaeon]
MAHNIARDNIIEILEKLLAKATTGKQQRILFLLSKDGFRFTTTTRAVKILAAELKCAESTVWDSLSVLKELGFVVCNGRIELTKTGKICSDFFGDENV